VADRHFFAFPLNSPPKISGCALSAVSQRRVRSAQSTASPFSQRLSFFVGVPACDFSTAKHIKSSPPQKMVGFTPSVPPLLDDAMGKIYFATVS
jgi:hypothetical protein